MGANLVPITRSITGYLVLNTRNDRVEPADNRDHRYCLDRVAPYLVLHLLAVTLPPMGRPSRTRRWVDPHGAQLTLEFLPVHRGHPIGVRAVGGETLALHEAQEPKLLQAVVNLSPAVGCVATKIEPRFDRLLQDL